MSINMNLPKHSGLFVVGTDAGVGKTVIAGAIAKILTDSGKKVGVFKPIATGCKRRWEGRISSDAEFLACCANSDLPLSTINPVGYATEAVPVVAAARERQPIDFDKIATAYKDICENSDLVIVEGPGGVRVPLTAEIDLIDLAAEFELPVIIVASLNKAAVNQTLMTIDCVRAANLKIAGVVVNGYSGPEVTLAEDSAPEVISQCGAVAVLSVVPFDETLDIEEPNLGEFVAESLMNCDWEKLASG